MRFASETFGAFFFREKFGSNEICIYLYESNHNEMTPTDLIHEFKRLDSRQKQVFLLLLTEQGHDTCRMMIEFAEGELCEPEAEPDDFTDLYPPTRYVLPTNHIH